MSKLSLLKNLNLLLVDDDSESLEILQIMLSAHFAKIFVCNNGLEALNLFQNTNIDMILTDYIMPHMDGYELCKSIRKINKKIPIVMMSNFSEKEKLLNMIPLKITFYLLKPASFQKLIESFLLMLHELEDNNLLNKNKYFSNYLYNFDTKLLLNIYSSNYILLTKSETIIIELLLKNINTIVTPSMINDVFKEIKSEQSIKNIIYRLRLKLGEKSIINLHGRGYILQDNRDAY